MIRFYTVIMYAHQKISLSIWNAVQQILTTFSSKDRRDINEFVLSVAEKFATFEL